MKKISLRRCARECATQAIYSWTMTQNPVEEVELAFISGYDFNDNEAEPTEKAQMDVPYFRKLLRGTVANLADIDVALRDFLDRNEDEVDPIERAILRLAGYELLYELDVPYRVVINEGIEVAKVFGSDDSHKYINGVLDKLAQRLGRQ